MNSQRAFVSILMDYKDMRCLIINHCFSYQICTYDIWRRKNHNFARIKKKMLYLYNIFESENPTKIQKTPEDWFKKKVVLCTFDPWIKIPSATPSLLVVRSDHRVVPHKCYHWVTIWLCWEEVLLSLRGPGGSNYLKTLENKWDGVELFGVSGYQLDQVQC